MGELVKTNLTNQIAEYIQNKISTGEWKEGEKIPSETELAKTLGVSRMSLRNGIQRTNVLGITETRVGEGTFVKHFDLRSYMEEVCKANLINSNANEITEMRDILQIGSVRLAMELPTLDDDLKEIEKYYDAMVDACKKEDIEALHKADIKFHKGICSLCRNQMMYVIYDAIEYLLDSTTKENMMESYRNNGSFDVLLDYHKSMIDSIADRDIDRFIDIIMKSQERSHFYRKTRKNSKNSKK